MTDCDSILFCASCPHLDLPQVGTSETERRRRRPNKGKKCPTVEQIKAKMGEGMEGDDLIAKKLKRKKTTVKESKVT